MISRNLKLLIILVISGTIGAYVVLVTVPTQLARRSYEGAKTLGEEFRKAFQFTPQIKVNNTIVLNQQTSVLELSVISQNFQHRYVWVNSWLGSTKKIFITGTFQAKAGFDLHKKFSINLRDEGAMVTLPEPMVLSVESLGDIEYRDDQGIWNWVNLDDRTKATNAFISDARKFADHAAFVGDAKSDMDRKLRELLKPYAQEVEISYTGSTRLRQQ
ncbi:MAG: DUF4230 domain-containing protein [Cyclobacteriaceae bacterium]